MTKYSILFLISAILILRAVTLGIPNLMEPTEGRYAAMAHRMVETGDWTFGQFPRGDSYEPYLGKPPLFFWLTALSFEKLGFSDWSARIPSFLSYLLITLSILAAGIALNRRKEFNCGALIWASSLIPFFFAGSVVLDVCLTATITISLLAAMIIAEMPHRTLFRALFWIGASMGFLIKGPVALILIFGPLVVFCWFEKSISLLRSLITPYGIISFLVMVTPWFFIAELKNPGFLYYFFINENFLRYFVKNYGDIYGSGHSYPYGTAIGFFILAFLPWTFLLGVKLFLFLFKKVPFPNIEKAFRLPLIAGVFMVLFFCGMKQIHIGYLIPAIPWTSLLVAHWFQKSSGMVLTAVVSAVVFSATLAVAHPFIDARFSSIPIIDCIAKHRPQLSEPVAVVGTKNYAARLLRSNWQDKISKSVPLRFVGNPSQELILPTNVLTLKSLGKDLNLSGYSKVGSIGKWEWWAKAGEDIPVNCSSD